MSSQPIQAASPSQRSLWVVDQIEAGVASLTHLDLDLDPLSLPSALLPEGAQEGSILTLNLTLDLAQTEREQAEIASRIEALSSEDDGGDFSL